MAPVQGKKKTQPAETRDAAPKDAEEMIEDSNGLNPIPELMRRAVALGLTGFFTTEEAVRKALGDTLPKDWADYLAETSDRTRSEFLECLSREIGGVLEGVDLSEVLKKLFEGRTLELKAEFRLVEDPDTATMTLRSAKKRPKKGD